MYTEDWRGFSNHTSFMDRETERQERKSEVKDPHTRVLRVASKVTHFPGQETLPICNAGEKKATEKVSSCRVEIRGKKRFCFVKEWLHLS